MFKNVLGGSVMVAILVALCIWVLSTNSVKLGIDLQGGTELLFSVDLTEVPTGERSSRNYAEDAKAVIANRIDETGLKEISVSVVGDRSILVEVPGRGEEEVRGIREMIRKAGQLSIHLVAEDQSDTAKTKSKEDYGNYLNEIARFNAGQRPEAPIPPERVVVEEKRPQSAIDNAEYVAPEFVLENDPSLKVDGQYLAEAFASTGQDGFPVIAFEFSGPGRTQFAELTGNNIGKRLAINLDGKAWSVATINSRIAGQGQLTGDFDDEEIRGIVTILNAGSLPADLVQENQQTIGPALGRASIERGIQAMGAGLVLVIVFMFFYYMAAGAVANLALALNLLLLISCLVVFRNTLTFPGLAGLLLTVGMTVDANILIFERIREEKQRGRSLNQAFTTGYQRAFWTIFDANLTTLITAYILYTFGTGPVKGFAIVLSIGIVASFFTAIYVTRLVLSIFMKAGMVTELKMVQLVRGTGIDFLQYAKPARTISVGLIIIGLLVMVVRGTDALGLDFTGGSRLLVNLSQPATEDRVRDLISSLTTEDGSDLFDDVQVQAVGTDDVVADSYGSFSIRTRTAGAAKERIAPDGTTVKESGTEAFQNAVQKALAQAKLLPPPGFSAAERQEDGSYTVVVHFKTGGVDLLPTQVETAMKDGQANLDAKERIEIASVNARDGDGSSMFESFVVRTGAIDPTLTVDGLYGRLAAGLRGVEELQISSAFAQVDAIGSRVAQDLQGKIFVAMMIAFGAIVFYVSLRFQFKFGLAAIVALVHDIAFTLGALALADLLLGGFLNLKISLAVMASLLTVVGYSLNDTIVIFDRIRENLEGKKRDVNYTEIVNLSINQTLRRTILTSATTFVVALILFAWGGDALQGFAFALCVGVVVGTYSSIYIASPALVYFHGRSEKRREAILAEAATAAKA